MIPSDAPKADWHMYYHDCFMSHIVDGPCRVYVQPDEGGKMSLQYRRVLPSTKLDTTQLCKPRDLKIMWPRPGAYNFKRYACGGFVGRQPQRHMKRSAFRDHYYMQWAPENIGAEYMMQQIAIGHSYMTVSKFFEELDSDVPVKSAAITNKCILYRPRAKDNISVIYMAEEIGFLTPRGFVPHQEADSRLPRILRHLRTAGIS